MLNGDAPQDALAAPDASNPGEAVRRGRGRPLGSLNKPKPPPMSPAQRQALKDELSVLYRQSIIDRALVETQTRGLASLIQAKLGKDGLAEIQAEVAREREARDAAADVSSEGMPAQQLAA